MHSPLFATMTSSRKTKREKVEAKEKIRESMKEMETEERREEPPVLQGDKTATHLPSLSSIQPITTHNAL